MNTNAEAITLTSQELTVIDLPSEIDRHRVIHQRGIEHLETRQNDARDRLKTELVRAKELRQQARDVEQNARAVYAEVCETTGRLIQASKAWLKEIG